MNAHQRNCIYVKFTSLKVDNVPVQSKAGFSRKRVKIKKSEYFLVLHDLVLAETKRQRRRQKIFIKHVSVGRPP
jgi:hypothetical protein